MEAKRKIIRQKMSIKGKAPYDVAEKYYAILSAVNDLKLTEREIQLIAFAAIKGDITASDYRTEFCEKYDSTGATINNIVSKLKKKKIFLKEGSVVFVNPIIAPDFENRDVTLLIQLNHEQTS
jgi:hypothetical protein